MQCSVAKKRRKATLLSVSIWGGEAIQNSKGPLGFVWPDYELSFEILRITVVLKLTSVAYFSRKQVLLCHKS